MIYLLLCTKMTNKRIQAFKEIEKDKAGQIDQITPARSKS